MATTLTTQTVQRATILEAPEFSVSYDQADELFTVWRRQGLGWTKVADASATGRIYKREGDETQFLGTEPFNASANSTDPVWSQLLRNGFTAISSEPLGDLTSGPAVIGLDAPDWPASGSGAR